MNEQELIIRVLDYKGDPYHFGVEQGKQLKQPISPIIQNKDTSKDAIKLLAEIAPRLLEELKGIAEGAVLPLAAVLESYGGYDIPFPEMGCSALVKDSYYVRNYDFSPDLYDARLVFFQPNKGFASVGFSQQIIGRLDGMNEKGLVIGLHFVNQQYRSKGFLATTIVRMILDQCATTAEAVRLIQKIPHGYCYNYSIMDKNGDSVIVEASPQYQEIIQTHPLACTNHFESENLQTKNKEYIQGSLIRRNYLQTLMKEELTPEEAFDHFHNPDSPLFFHNYKEYFGTLHTVLYSPHDLSVMIGIGSGRELFTFSFKEWLNGTLFLADNIRGNILYNK
ncbi:C45 family peptidase [Bacillus sp. FJAT-49736]|uniref:C45 family autoproteolytic acyltransferase/hydolase n=1 Tax=Bacillus sp. FJAT-49736 TaxID=2833582 RepID=UPI001BC94EDA|nr:C45 family peptidase [Bacillus sp. FJAT-49736]MBS4174593.1 acyl-CoA--6-aminopenicillanic acid acyltransferase [Bacillus sp. FJAT-49736]